MTVYTLVVAGLTVALAAAAPILQKYEAAPEAVKPVTVSGQTEADAGVTVSEGNGLTEMLMLVLLTGQGSV